LNPSLLLLSLALLRLVLLLQLLLKNPLLFMTTCAYTTRQAAKLRESCRSSKRKGFRTDLHTGWTLRADPSGIEKADPLTLPDIQNKLMEEITQKAQVLLQQAHPERPSPLPLRNFLSPLTKLAIRHPERGRIRNRYPLFLIRISR